MSSLLVLASRSPRRIEMLRHLGFPYMVHPVAVDETPNPGELPDVLVSRLSRTKAEAGADLYPAHPILGVDTVVFAQGSILGKPPHEGSARQMLHLLSGHSHQVWTGYHILDRSRSISVTNIVMTEVDVRPISDEEMTAYLRSEEWRGKAGGYAIQGRFAMFVRKIHGSYESVVGLPLCALIEDLIRHHVAPKGFPSWSP